MNYHNDVSEHWSFDVGVDLRKYKGIHYRVVNDVLGANYYIDYDNINNPTHIIRPDQFVAAKPSFNPWANIKDQEKIDYYNEGLVDWQGVFGQGEWKNEFLSAFVQASFSNQGYERIEYFNETPENQKSGVKNLTGGNIKGGLNWRINDVHNVFFNSGYYSKQPLFRAVYINFGNNLNPNLTNETVISFELGYGLRMEKFSLNANLYRTSWADRFVSRSVTIDEFRGTANFTGITEIHTGVEVDFFIKVLNNLRINGMVSVGNWEYKGNSEASIFNDDQELIGTETLYLDGVKVGDAAQTTASLGVTYDFFKGFSAGIDWRYAANLYAVINVLDFREPDHLGSLKLPSFNLVDARISYRWLMKRGNTLGFGLNVNNVFDALYISESDTNIHTTAGDDVWNGINTRNRVFFGWGRAWNFSIRYRW
jgi:outer membrane receptor for ferrienterochelin and colicin